MAEKDSVNLLPPGAIAVIILRPMVIGIMIEQLLLGILLCQAITYFRYHFSTDSTFCKSITSCLVVSTVFLGTLDFIVLYRSLVLDYGNYEKLDLQGWIFWAEASLTAWIAFVTHVFYIFRCWAVTRSLPICMFLGVVASTSLVSGITVTVYGLMAERMSEPVGIHVPAAVWFISTGACDLGIAFILVLYLWRRKSVLRSAEAMISRLRRTTMETGSLTAFCALLNLVLFSTMPEEGYVMIIQYSTSHLYAMSVLYTLFGRQNLRNILKEGSGTFVTEFQTSFLAAGVISTSLLDNRFNENVPKLRNNALNSVVHDRCRLGTEQSRGEDSV